MHGARVEMLFETRLTEARDPIVRNGTLIRIGCNGERFWCVVREIKRDGRVLAPSSIMIQSGCRGSGETLYI